VIINNTMGFYSVDHPVMFYNASHRMEYLIGFINVNVIESKVDLLHCISLLRF